MGPGEDADVFYVHFMPVNGDTQRLDIDFSTAADARYAMHRLNEMLAQVCTVLWALSEVSLGSAHGTS